MCPGRQHLPHFIVQFLIFQLHSRRWQVIFDDQPKTHSAHQKRTCNNSYVFFSLSFSFSHSLQIYNHLAQAAQRHPSLILATLHIFTQSPCLTISHFPHHNRYRPLSMSESRERCVHNFPTRQPSSTKREIPEGRSDSDWLSWNSCGDTKNLSMTNSERS